MMKRNKLYIIFCFCVIMFVLTIGCSQKDSNNHANDDHGTENNNHTSNEKTQETNDKAHDVEKDRVPKSESGKPLYYEVNEPFIMRAYNGAPIWINVEEIWTEPGGDHEAYIAEQRDDPSDDDNVTFINLAIKNRGSKLISYFDVLPTFYGDTSGGKTIDLSYPENDVFKHADDSIERHLEPEENVEVIGASVSRVDDENNGVVVWRDMEYPKHPTVVFQTPQSERRDQFGIYDFGETIYALDKSEEQQLNATIHDVVVDDASSVDKNLDDSMFIMIDMEIENTGTATQMIVEALPLAVINGEPIEQMMVFDNGKGLVEDPWGDSQIDIKPDETLDGTLYIEVDDSLVQEAQLYFFDNALLIYPDYAMKLNYNLDKKTD